MSPALPNRDLARLQEDLTTSIATAALQHFETHLQFKSLNETLDSHRTDAKKGHSEHTERLDEIKTMLTGQSKALQSQRKALQNIETGQRMLVEIYEGISERNP